MTSRCVTGMRTADKHFPARVFRTMQKQPTTQPTPLTSSLGISPHLAASLGYSYLQGIFANKTRPLLAPVCITACLVAGEISGQTANQRAFAHIDHKHSVNIGKSVKEMGNILKMASAFLCSSSGAICKTAVWNSCSGFTTIFANSGSLF